MMNDDDERIRDRAYAIWEREGRPHGRHESHWHRALAELGLVVATEQEPGTTVDPQSAVTASGIDPSKLATEASTLVKRYLALGGVRKAVADDNEISTRVWENEPTDAADYWDRNVASLPEAQRREVESLLPSISGDTR
jgi:hypothetical protein